MRTILFGAGGQLGVELTREARRRGHSVTALCRSQLDISDEDAVSELIRRRLPDCVINAAAYNEVDGAENDPCRAMRINAIAVRSIAKVCRESGSTFLHYSTDYVFDGERNSPYTEDDRPDPQSAYGVSKLAGELFARGCCTSHYVLRVAGVYATPGRYTNHGNFAEFVLRKCAEGVPLRILDDHFATPTCGRELATRTMDILERRIPYGLYHLGGGQVLSWFDFARRIAAAGGYRAEIAASSCEEYSPLARRPAFSALSNARIEEQGIAPMPSIDECLRRYVTRRLRERPGGVMMSAASPKASNSQYSDRDCI